MHPSSIPPSGLPRASWLQPDNSAAHQETFLPLLPSGSDGVQKLLIAQNPVFSATLLRSNKRCEDLWMGIQSRYSGLRVQGTAISPSSTTYNTAFHQRVSGKYGGADGDRTHDLQIANLALSQLSYCPVRINYGGESGIRTHGRGLPYTRFPVVHLRPLGHLSAKAFYLKMAERVGFEPTVTIQPHRFSRPARSTTPAPLLNLLGRSQSDKKPLEQLGTFLL